MMKVKNIALAMALGLALTSSAIADKPVVEVTQSIVSSETWTADNIYDLKAQIYVMPGATLTIEAGTLVRSTATPQVAGGSLAVTRGAQIHVKGTQDAPVIMTSTNDPMDSWEEGAYEWGNLTILGAGLISASQRDGNVAYPSSVNEFQMEGLSSATPGDSRPMYGGGNDDDDSGSIAYLSIRRGGRVIGEANELNGLSLGGVGRETEIHHVEIMNNIDDGIEIWGGTVCLKYVCIWNIGDDSFDLDQGWRGKAQFGLIVQGYADADAKKQGDGFGDNCFEMDGAETDYAQPVTTATIANFTVIGNPLSGDHGAMFKDNCRVQFRNCIFMQTGDEVVGTNGDYGDNGELAFAALWSTPAGTHMVNNNAPGANPGDYNHPDTLYQAQITEEIAGMSPTLCEIKNSVFWQNLSDDGDPFTLANTLGVFDADNRNVIAPADVSDPTLGMPIQAITRAATETVATKQVQLVTWLNPCAAGLAIEEDGEPIPAGVPADGFFTPAPFRGGFSATYNWLEGWTAADAYGLVDTSMNDDHATPTADAAVQVVTVTEFETEAGVIYTVEKSSDLSNWTPIDTVIGDGTTMSVEDLDTFEAGKFYRVIKQ